MADFKTHITASTILGVGYGSIGYALFDVPPAHALVATALCSVAGMLPDLDSNSGIPQREMLSFVSVVVPMLMIDRLEQLHLNHEQMVFVAGAMYVLIRFGIGNLFKKFTKHRGMWHSIPAAFGRRNGNLFGLFDTRCADPSIQSLGSRDRFYLAPSAGRSVRGQLARQVAKGQEEFWNGDEVLRQRPPAECFGLREPDLVDLFDPRRRLHYGLHV